MPVLPRTVLDAVIVHPGAIMIFLLDAVQRPAGHGAGGFGHILFGVMAFAQGEEFHALAGKIFVGMLLAALRLVEPDQHGRVGGDGVEQIEPIARSHAAESVDLLPHEIGVAHLDGAGGEMAVPEKGQFLLQRARPFGHALEPLPAHLLQSRTLIALDFLHGLRRFSASSCFCSSVRSELISWRAICWRSRYRSLRSGSGLAQSGRSSFRESFRNRQNRKPRLRPQAEQGFDFRRRSGD
jgi:hypothetical protein